MGSAWCGLWKRERVQTGSVGFQSPRGGNGRRGLWKPPGSGNPLNPIGCGLWKYLGGRGTVDYGSTPHPNRVWTLEAIHNSWGSSRPCGLWKPLPESGNSTEEDTVDFGSPRARLPTGKLWTLAAPPMDSGNPTAAGLPMISRGCNVIPWTLEAHTSTLESQYLTLVPCSFQSPQRQSGLVQFIQATWDRFMTCLVFVESSKP